MVNRADRRRHKIEDRDPVLNLKESEIREQLQKVKKEAIREAAKITSALFSLSLNNKHGFGEKRINDLLEDVKNQMDCILSGHLSGTDVVNWCKEKNLNCFELGGGAE
jgi:hypothetical protein